MLPEEVISVVSGGATPTQIEQILGRHLFRIIDRETAHHLFTVAAIGGNVETLEWLHRNNCPRKDEFLCLFAAQGLRKDVILWLREHCIGWGNMDCEELKLFYERERIDGREFITWLLSLSCPKNFRARY